MLQGHWIGSLSGLGLHRIFFPVISESQTCICQPFRCRLEVAIIIWIHAILVVLVYTQFKWFWHYTKTIRDQRLPFEQATRHAKQRRAGCRTASFQHASIPHCKISSLSVGFTTVLCKYECTFRSSPTTKMDSKYSGPLCFKTIAQLN